MIGFNGVDSFGLVTDKKRLTGSKSKHPSTKLPLILLVVVPSLVS